jgi:adenosine deaminase
MMFGNSLAEEYRSLESELGFSRDEIRQLILQGIRSSWLPEDRKDRLIDDFQQDPHWRPDSSGPGQRA